MSGVGVGVEEATSPAARIPEAADTAMASSFPAVAAPIPSMPQLQQQQQHPTLVPWPQQEIGVNGGESFPAGSWNPIHGCVVPDLRRLDELQREMDDMMTQRKQAMAAEPPRVTPSSSVMHL